MESSSFKTSKLRKRRYFVGGSDARIIMGNNEAALIRLWREKRGEIEPEDLSGNLVVQLGVATEDLNRRWYEANTGQVVTDIQKRVHHPALRWMGATLDGRIEGDAVFEAKFMLPWSFSEEAAAEKYMPQLQHNMWVVAARSAVLSVITGGGKWVEIVAHADPLYQHLIVTAERKFWHCVESGEQPTLFGVEPPRARLEAVRIVDMTASNAWAEFAAIFTRTRAAHLEHEQAKAELKMICGRQPSDPHHLRFAQCRALGRKVSDEFTVPLCRTHHREIHRSDNEGSWWHNMGIDPLAAARGLWLETHPLARAKATAASDEAATTFHATHAAPQR
jgi:predicted phage-related endonuclease